MPDLGLEFQEPATTAPIAAPTLGPVAPKPLTPLQAFAQASRLPDPEPKLDTDQDLLQTFRALAQRDLSIDADAREIAKTFGTRPDAALQDIKVLRELRAEREFLDRRLSERNPVLAGWLGRQQFAAVAKDDLDSFVQHDEFYSRWARALKSGWSQRTHDRIGIAARDNPDQRPNDLQKAQALELEALHARVQQESPWAGPFFQVLAQAARSAISAVPIAWTAAKATTAVTGNPLAGATAASFAGAATVFGDSAWDGTGRQYLRLLEDGVEPDRAWNYAMGYGVVEGALEVFAGAVLTRPVRSLLRDRAAAQVGKLLEAPTMKAAQRSFWWQWGSSVGSELWTEGTQTLAERVSRQWALQTLGEEAQKKATANDESFATEMALTLRDTFLAMAPLGGFLPAAKLYHDSRRIAAARENVARWNELQDLKAESKAATTSPEAYLDHLREQIKARGLSDTVYVDAAMLKQMLRIADEAAVAERARAAGMSPAEMLAQMGGEGPETAALRKELPEMYAQLEDAAGDGDFVPIPRADYEAKVVGKPLHDVMRDHLSLDPNGLTAAQAKVLGQDRAAKVAAARKAIAADIETRDQWEKETDEIVTEVAETLRTSAVRRLDQANATLSARFLAAVVATRARADGVTPAAWWAAHKLTILSERVQPEAVQKALAQAGTKSQTPLDQPEWTFTKRDELEHQPWVSGPDSTPITGLVQSLAWALDDRSHGDEYIAAAAELAAKQMFGEQQAKALLASASAGADEQQQAVAGAVEMGDQESRAIELQWRTERIAEHMREAEGMGVDDLLAQPGEGETAPKPPARLFTLHSLSAESVQYALSIGGLAAPSIGVVSDQRGAVPEFGGVTLIGRKSLGDPASEPVYDADIWSQRWPQPVHKKPKTSAWHKWVRRFWGNEYQDGADNELTDLVRKQNVDGRKFREVLSNSNAAMAIWLREQGETPAAPVLYPWSSRTGLSRKALEELREQYRADAKAEREGGDAFTLEMRNELENQLVERAVAMLRQELQPEFEALGWPTQGEENQQELDKLARGRIGTHMRLSIDITSLDQPLMVNARDTREALRSQIGSRASQFQAWVERQTTEVLGDPMVLVGRKRLPYTLQNIVEAMTRGPTKAQEEAFTFNTGLVRAHAAQRIKSVAELRNRAEWQLGESDEAVSAARADFDTKREAFHAAITPYSTESTWAALDGSMRAVARFLARGPRSPAAMRAALSREWFKASEIPADVIKQAVEFAKLVETVPVPYFEAKPQRAVRISEFAAAMVPTGPDFDIVVNDLQAEGLMVRRIDRDLPNADRTRIARELAEQAHEKHGNVLFQREALPNPMPDPADRFLAVTHSLNGNVLEAALNLGGLVVPSLAVQRVDQDLSLFGDVILVGSPALADASQEPWFSADVWSQTFSALDGNMQVASDWQSIEDLNEEAMRWFQTEMGLPKWAADAITERWLAPRFLTQIVDPMHLASVAPNEATVSELMERMNNPTIATFLLVKHGFSDRSAVNWGTSPEDYENAYARMRRLILARHKDMLPAQEAERLTEMLVPLEPTDALVEGTHRFAAMQGQWEDWKDQVRAALFAEEQRKMPSGGDEVQAQERARTAAVELESYVTDPALERPGMVLSVGTFSEEVLDEMRHRRDAGDSTDWDRWTELRYQIASKMRRISIRENGAMRPATIDDLVGVMRSDKIKNDTGVAPEFNTSWGTLRAAIARRLTSIEEVQIVGRRLVTAGEERKAIGSLMSKVDLWSEGAQQRVFVAPSGRVWSLDIWKNTWRKLFRLFVLDNYASPLTPDAWLAWSDQKATQFMADNEAAWKLQSDAGDPTTIRAEQQTILRDVIASEMPSIAQFAAEFGRLPTDYLEGKPQRVVRFDEFVAAVAESGNISETTKDLLRTHGIRVYEAPRGSRESMRHTLMQAAQDIEADGHNVLFQRGFHSALQRSVETAPFASATGKRWLETIKSWQNKGLVKEAEVEFTGIREYLEANEGTDLKREDLHKWLDSRVLRIEPHTHGLPDYGDESGAQAAARIEPRKVRQAIEDISPADFGLEHPDTLRDSVQTIGEILVDAGHVPDHLDGEVQLRGGLHFEKYEMEAVGPWTEWDIDFDIEASHSDHSPSQVQLFITANRGDDGVGLKVNVNVEMPTGREVVDSTTLRPRLEMSPRNRQWIRSEIQRHDAASAGPHLSDADLVEVMKQIEDTLDQINDSGDLDQTVTNADEVARSTKSAIEDAETAWEDMTNALGALAYTITDETGDIEDAYDELRGTVVRTAGVWGRNELDRLLDAIVAPQTFYDWFTTHGSHGGPLKWDDRFKVPGPREDKSGWEALLTIPGSFYSKASHWSDDGVAVHIRGDVRLDVNGVRTLMVSELQSDWHQDGMAQGWDDEKQKAADAVRLDYLKKRLAKLGILAQALRAQDQGGFQFQIDVLRSSDFVTIDEVTAIEREQAELFATAKDKSMRSRTLTKLLHDAEKELKKIEKRKSHGYPTPNHPFVRQQERLQALAIKKALMIADQLNCAQVAFVTGEESSVMFSLDTTFRSITVERDRSTYDGSEVGLAVTATRHDGRTSQRQQVSDFIALEEWIGPQLTERFRNVMDADPANPIDSHTLSGEGLKFEDVGRRKLYDEIIPKIAGQIAKRVGARMATIETLSVTPEMALKRKDRAMMEAARKIVREDAAMPEAVRIASNAYWTESAFDVFMSARNEYQLHLESQGVSDARAESMVRFEQWKKLLLSQFSALQEMQKRPAIVLTDETREALESGLPVWQGEFGGYIPQALTMILFRRANLSTFLHEVGHYYLDTLLAAAASPNASAATLEEAGQWLRWFGVDSIESWQGLSARERARHHEALTYNLELYLATGKAPSVELRTLFARVKEWMKQIYRDIVTTLNERYRSQFGTDLPALTPEVRGLFDRMLATDQQIKDAMAIRDVMPLFGTQQESGYNDEDWKDYQQRLQAAQQEASESMTRDSVEAMQWLSEARSRLLRDLQRQHDGVRKRIQAEVREELLSEPVYQVIDWITSGRVGEDPERQERRRIDADSVEALVGAGVWAKLRTKFGIGRGRVFGRDSLHPDMVARKFGLTGDEMLRRMADLPPIDEAIRLETDRRMVRDYSDLHDPKRREELASRALHGEARGRLLEAELAAIQRLQRTRAASAEQDTGRIMADANAQATLLDEQVRKARKTAVEMERAEDVGNADRGRLLVRREAIAAELKAAREAKDQDAITRLSAERGQVLEQIDALRSPALRAAQDQVADLEDRLAEARRVSSGRAFDPRASKLLRAAARATAQDVLDRTPYRELRTLLARTDASEAKANRDVVQAIADQDLEAAARAAERRLQLHEIRRLGAQEMERLERLMAERKRLFAPRADVARRRNQDLVEAGRFVLEQFGLATASQARGTANQMEALRKYDQGRWSEIVGLLSWAQENGKDYRDLTLAELREVLETVRSLWREARGERLIEVERQQIGFQAARADLQQDLDRLEKRDPAVVEKIQGQTTKWDAMRRLVSGVKAALRRVESWARAVGPAWQRLIFRPVQAAIDGYRVRSIEYVRKYHDLLDGIRDILPEGRIYSKELDYEFGRRTQQGLAEIVGALMHVGNLSNYRKLLLGYGWATEDSKGRLDDSQFRAFLERLWLEGVLNERHLRFVQATWDLFETLKPAAQRAHRAVFGFYFDEIPARQFVGPWGDILRGGYTPAKTDRSRVDPKQMKFETLEEIQQDFRQGMPAAPSGFRHARVEAYARPLDLSLARIARALDENIRFSALQPVIKQTLSLLNDSQIENQLARLDPEAKRKMLLPWLTRVANNSSESPGSIELLDKLARGLRSRTGLLSMFTNVSNTLQQATGFVSALSRVSPRVMLATWWQWIQNPAKFARETKAMSQYVQVRIGDNGRKLMVTLREIDDGAGVIQRFQTWGQTHAYWLQNLMAWGMEPIIWRAAFTHYIEKAGLDRDNAEVQAAAVAHADEVLRDTQGATEPEAEAAYAQGNPVVRAVTQFTGFFNAMLNLQITTIGELWRDMGWKALASPRLYGVTLLSAGLPLFLAEVIAKTFAGRWEDEDDDGMLDEIGETFGLSIARGGAAMIPVAGQGLNALINAMDDQAWNDRLTISPTLSMLERTILRTPGSIAALWGDRQVTGTEVRDIANLLTILTGSPVFAAAGRPAAYLQDVETGRATPSGGLDVLRGLLTGARGK